MSHPTKAERAARERVDVRRARNRRRRQAQRLNQRERARNLSLSPVVVEVPGPGKGGAGQQRGRIVGGEHHSPELRAAFDRLAEARAQEAAGRG